MKALRKTLDKIKPHFEKGGKLYMFNSLFGSVEVLFFVPDKVTNKGSHIRDGLDMKRTMITVWFALFPALLFGMYNIGLQYSLSSTATVSWLGNTLASEFTVLQMFLFGLVKFIPLFLVSFGVGLGVEIVFAKINGHAEVAEGYFVSGLLIPMIVPVDVPLWQLTLAVIFAVIIGKEVFGGTGMNILNPALVARAFLFFSYPKWMSGDSVWIEGLTKGQDIVDGFSGATPLALAAANDIGSMPSMMEMMIGTIPGSIGETSFIAIMLGAAILIFTGIGSWKIIVSTFAGGYAMALLLNIFAVNPYMELPAHYHLIMGGFAFGAVFMATDPVTGSQTEKGKWIYGLLIGILAVLIRVLNPAFPEGMMLAILFMNVFAPLIDHYVLEANIKKRLKRATSK
ncbi:MAG: NADH:ubiquinone reductase (Na(+)-transporting) subunit B [Marinilabiliaceae bacterium]|jgi:Na+-transporting NADH:ubiquinone oxidoreductase subunit B|nr:NADH:ubiquinone reductase (Na(+)-transporting) subunit B [Marinilabiliaceae bacterium]